MKNLIYVPLLILLFWACSDTDKQYKNADDSISANAKLTFEVVDSIAIDYLGRLRFCDISPDRTKYLFHDSQRGNFLTTDKQGNVLHEFIKIGDRPDLPSFVSDNPVFLANDRIGLVGMGAAYVYDLDGESLQIFRDEEVSGMARMIMMGLETKTLHAFEIDGKRQFLKGVYPAINNNEDKSYLEQLDAIRAIELIDPATKTFTRKIGIPNESKFKNGPEYTAQMMNPIVHPSNGKLYKSYANDTHIFVYGYQNGEFELVETIAMNPELFYGDEPKASDNFELGIRPNGAGKVVFAYGHGNVLYTSYNPGVKMEDRSLPNVQRSGQSISVSVGQPVNLPKDRFQYFVNGQKIGNDFEKPDFLGRVVMGDEGYLWFARDTTNDEDESDFITFYKVKAVEKK